MRLTLTVRWLPVILSIPALALVAGTGGLFSSVADAQQAHSHAPAKKVQEAIAVMQPKAEKGVSGVVRFTQQGASIHIHGEIKGLKPGLHGFHVHEFGDITSDDGMSTGGHFNPEGSDHGRPDHGTRHVGDLGNVRAGEDGVAKIDMTDKVLKLEGPHSILGRGLVVHVGEDKFTQPTGDAGGRAAVGVIGVANSAPKPTR